LSEQQRQAFGQSDWRTLKRGLTRFPLAGNEVLELLPSAGFGGILVGG